MTMEQIAEAHGLPLYTDWCSGTYVDTPVPADGLCPACHSSLGEGSHLDSGDSALVVTWTCPVCGLAWEGEAVGLD